MQRKPPKFSECIFFAKYILLSLLFNLVYKKHYMQREIYLPAAEAFAFSSPAGRLRELSHSIKA